jgi:hypothetical protein
MVEKILKGKALFYVFPFKCMLLCGSYLIPNSSKPASSVTDFVAECNSQKYVWQSTTYEYNNNLYLSSRTEQNPLYKARLLQAVSSLAITNLTSKSDVILYFGCYDYLSDSDLQQVYQLIDIPPPSI